MLPYSLKVVWFALSLAGLLSNWTVLPGFARHVFTSPWAALLYTVANTVQQGIFCVGLAWKMSLFNMPRGFCIAQTVATHVSWACLAGLCASTALSSAAAVFPSCSGFARISRLPLTVALTTIFPVVVLVLQLTFLLKLDAAQPVDGMNCDASQPSWVRVLGYAGLTLLLSVPSFVLSVVTSVRARAHPRRVATKPRPVSHAMLPRDTLTPIPSRRDRKPDSKPNSRFSSLVTADASSQYVIKPSPVHLPTTLYPEGLGRSPTLAPHSKYHLPFDNPPPLAVDPASRRESAQSQTPSQGLRRSPALESTRTASQAASQHSPSPIIFATPPAQAGQNPNIVVVNVSQSHSPTGESEKDAAEAGRRVSLGELDVDVVSDEAGSLHWTGESDRGSIGKDELTYEHTEEAETGEYVFPPYPRIRRVASGLPPWLDEPTEADPTLPRTVAFQIFMAATQILAAVTSLVDIFSNHHPPSPIGTQHVAQLLAAWGPCFFVCALLLSRFRK